MTDDWQYGREDDQLVAGERGNRARRITWGAGLLGDGALAGAVIVPLRGGADGHDGREGAVM